MEFGNNNKMNLLFICTQNINRSKTAEIIYSNKLDINVRSAGISNTAIRIVNKDDLKWADVIIVFESIHSEIIKREYGKFIKDKEIVNLDIEDEYLYMEDELIIVIKSKMLKHGFNI